MNKIDPSKCKILYSSIQEWKLVPAFFTIAQADIVIAEALNPGDYLNTGDKVLRKGEPVIIISMGLAKFLTEKELYAVLCHEYGHILNGDGDNFNGTVLDQMSREFEIREYKADDYAVTQVPKNLYIVALLKAVQFIIDSTTEVYGKESNAIALKVLKNQVSRRIDRLLS